MKKTETKSRSLNPIGKETENRDEDAGYGGGNPERGRLPKGIPKNPPPAETSPKGL